MTDLEKFLKLYRSVGVEPEIRELENGKQLYLDPCDYERDGKIQGYSSFYCTINFDKNGKFENQGIWE